MSAENLTVEKREETGTLRIRRLRKAGKIPAVLYGHGQESLNLSIDQNLVSKTVHAGQYIVSLTGAVTETAMIKEVQWNAFGTEILHLDLARVDANEAVEVTLPLNLKGDCPGVGLGGMVVQLMHDIKINCPANIVPEALEVAIDNLELGGSIAADDIPLPAGASLITNGADAVVSCNEPRGAKSGDADAEEAPADGAADEGASENKSE